MERDGFSVKAFETGDALLTAYRVQRPDLVILDVMMPGTDGLTILTEIRQNDKDLPIILLTARDSDADFITAFTLGTDDYFTKPFSPIKLSLHVKALLKRRQKEAEVSQSKTYKDLCLNSVARRAQLAGQELLLTKTEFDLLEVLMENAGMAYSRDELLDCVWALKILKAELWTIPSNAFGKNGRPIPVKWALRPFGVMGLGQELQTNEKENFDS
ncbi:OmpR family TCS DNA-binding response regulator [Streptococcus dysgalactiae subsp. equisimilis]|nr:OmpR family TCS DNA-binding response regulator [Streptococcus dysgalactiae subsp. equisimilis]WEQ83149.1 OmpR family TCS DNA-binding response regulator [Streptococcus dysgalactiae subsp. equisimilis]WEQ85261.1 OmpR family TCS DNA-binding response regulator [Streptococcus dysgalactiae subsp. equisimilis]WEQ87265.1 OmpR family TCS DNA-binding response regulator [Streptococcus dysgalactiae subsp. equisimilis]WEQ89392.1 OmpR family TCS DNA-binding response regulator [Streptococcus dysgalactiae s